MLPTIYVRGAQRQGREYEMSDCLHCDINQLVQGRLERGEADVGELASMMVESLADLVLLAPEAEQAHLLAYVSDLGQMFFGADVLGEEWRGGGRLECHSLELGAGAGWLRRCRIESATHITVSRRPNRTGIDARDVG